MMKFNTAIFDLDGTILDTLEDLKNSTNAALRKNNLPERTLDEVRAFVGNGIRLLIERAVPPNTSKSIIDKCFQDFKEDYKKNSAIYTKPYNNIIEVVTKLKDNGVKLGVVSNKADFAVQELMNQYFNGLFNYAVGERDGVRRKPCPDSVLACIEYLKADKTSTVYIGDSDVDIETANNSDLPCISVTWGFRDRRLLESLNTQYIIENPKDLLDIIL